MACGKASVAGSVSQRACVFCGSRVVLYPIADALHIVHGPIGCAAYTWDIRGALSSGPQLHRNSFSTDLQEMDVIYGGEKKLEAALLELIAHHSPKAAFVYSTCIVGLIGDDVSAVCKRVAAKTGIPVLGVHSEGFKGTKKDGYKAACDALLQTHRHRRHLKHQSAQHQHPRRIQSRRRNVDSARLLQTHGHRGRFVPHRRLADRGHPPRARREAESGSMLRLDDQPRQNDGARLRHSLQARFLFRHRGHERRALRGREIFQGRPGDHGPRAKSRARGSRRHLSRTAALQAKAASARRRRFTSAARSRRFR